MDLVFDLDGVLLDSEAELGWLWSALDDTLEHLGVPVTAANRERLAPANLGELPAVASDWGLPAEEVWAVRNEYYLEAKLAAIETGRIGPFDDVDAIEDLGDTPHHIISNSPRAVVDAFVSTNGFDALFDVRLGRGDGIEWLDRLKPAPYLYEELVAATGRANGYLYVGDTPTDRAFAAATGMDYYHVRRAAGAGLHALRRRVA